MNESISEDISLMKSIGSLQVNSCLNQIRAAIIIVSLLLTFPQFAQAQKEEKSNPKRFRVTIKCLNKRKEQGFLYMVTDSAIYVADKIVKKGEEQTYKVIPYFEIRKIYMIRHGTGGIGFAIGVSASILSGVLSYSINSNAHPEDQGLYFIAVVLGIFASPVIGLVGAIVVYNFCGRHYHINYDYNNFINFKEKLAGKGQVSLQDK